MSRDEFMALIESYESEEAPEREMNAQDYWDMHSGPEGMSFKDFEDAYQHADPNVT
jgi:hypothetical protein